ncbi:MAG: hypothetical protein NTW49_08715 [Bacteroidia bacterium]|nr:hypothetical protein [Bacteroidia bacterium]
MNTSNYFEVTRSINFSDLPEALKNGNKLVQGASQNNWSAYHSNENIRRVVDSYMEKLDDYLEKNEVKPEKESEVPAPVVKKPKQKSRQPKAKPEKNVKAEKKEKKPKVSKPARPKKQPKAKKAKKQDTAEKVEKIKPEIAFIRRYVLLDGKTRTQKEILSFINTLQKAILEKRIRKTSPYAKEIENIQDQLISCYQKMGDSIAISIDKDTLAKYHEIAYSEKTMLSVTYIKQYISLHGKSGVKEKAKVLFDKLTKAVKNMKIIKNDPYADKLNLIYNALNDYLTEKTKSPQISKSELNGLMGIAKAGSKKKVRPVAKIRRIKLL